MRFFFSRVELRRYSRSSMHHEHHMAFGIMSALDALLCAVQSAATMHRYDGGGHKKGKRPERVPHERSKRKVSSLPPAAFRST